MKPLGADDRGREPTTRLPVIDDAGIAVFATQGGSKEGIGGITSVVVTDNYMRKSRCGVPGCGLERSDPIHQVDADQG